MQILKRSIFLVSSLVLAVCISACSATNVHTDTQPAMDSLVSAEWLSEHIDDPDLVLLDCTVLVQPDGKGGFESVSGNSSYLTGHIPSAGFADLMGKLSDNNSPFDFVMPSAQQFSLEMGALGVSNDSKVVLYSASQQSWSARVWWMLRWAGFDQVAILDGGMQAWVNAGYPLSTEPGNRPARRFIVSPKAELIADHDEVFAAIGKQKVSLVDAMPEIHYRGEMVMYDRPGHIPGAVNMPSSDLLDEAGLYKSNDELDMMFESSRDNRVITYCGGGVAASSVAFSLHRLGFKDVAVYMGSLQEWTPDLKNPMTTETP